MALPRHIRLEFVTPDRVIARDDVDEVELPGEAGYFGVLPGHTPLLAALQTGEMWYRVGSEKHYAFVDGGYAEVVPDRVSVLARVAVLTQGQAGHMVVISLCFSKAEILAAFQQNLER